MTDINKFVVLVILSVFDSSKSLVKLPSVEDNDILKTEVAIRTTLNNLLSLLQLRGSPENSKIKQYTTVHNFFVTETLQDYDTLKEIAKLTRVDKSTLQNVTTNFIALLNEGISSNYFSKTSSPNTEDLNNLEDEIQRLQYMKHIYASPKQYSKINKEVLKILEHRDDKITNATEKTEAAVDKENKVLKDLGNIAKLLGESDTWIPHSLNKTRRIYQGKLAKDKHFPFVATIEIFKKFHCGASIIKNDLLVTAASCIQLAWNNRFYRENPLFLQVRVGSEYIHIGGEAIPIMEIYFYPTYDPKTLEHNIAVMRTVRQMNLREHNNIKVKRIEMDSRNYRMPENVEVLVLGWGAHTSSNMIHSPSEPHLRKYFVPVYGLEECQEVYTKKYVTATNFCAGFISGGTGGACNRDAGGPAVLNGYLVGVISFGSPICGAPDAPTVFTKVGHYYEWLKGIFDMEASFLIKKTTFKPKEALYKDFYTNQFFLNDDNDSYWYITPMTDPVTFGLANYQIVRLTTKYVDDANRNTVLTPVTYPPTPLQSDDIKELVREGINYESKMTTEKMVHSEATHKLKQTPKNEYYDSFNLNQKEKAQTKKKHKKPKIKSKQEQLILFKKFLKSIFENEDEVREYLNLLNMSDAYYNESGMKMVQNLLMTPKTGYVSTELTQKNNTLYDEKPDDIGTGQAKVPCDEKNCESLAESYESTFKNVKGTKKYYEDEMINDSGSLSKSHEIEVNSLEKFTESEGKGLRTARTVSKSYSKDEILSDVNSESQNKNYKKDSKVPAKFYKKGYKTLGKTNQSTGQYVRTPKTIAKFYTKTVKVSETLSASNETSSESDEIETSLPNYEIKTSRTTHTHKKTTEFVRKPKMRKRKTTKPIQRMGTTPNEIKSSSEVEHLSNLEDTSNSEGASPLYPIQNNKNEILKIETDVDVPAEEFEKDNHSNKKHVLKLNNQNGIEEKDGLYELDEAMVMPTTPYDESGIFKMYFGSSNVSQTTTEIAKVKKHKTKRPVRNKMLKDKLSPYLKVFHHDDSLVNVLDGVAYNNDDTEISIEEQNSFFDQATKDEMFTTQDIVDNKVGIEKVNNEEQSSKYQKGFKDILLDIVEKVFDGTEILNKR